MAREARLAQTLVELADTLVNEFDVKAGFRSVQALPMRLRARPSARSTDQDGPESTLRAASTPWLRITPPRAINTVKMPISNATVMRHSLPLGRGVTEVRSDALRARTTRTFRLANGRGVVP